MLSKPFVKKVLIVFMKSLAIYDSNYRKKSQKILKTCFNRNFPG
jgi:uncharacterized membrane protein